jgi:O-antigen/teichoic acid export membrane protein
LVIFGFLGALAVLLAGVFAYFAPLIFNIPGDLVADTRLVLLVGGMTMGVTLVGAVFGGVIAGLERFDINSGVEIVVTATRTVVIVLALLEGYGLVSLALIHLASSIVSGLANWVIARRLYPKLRLRLRIRLLPHVRKILSFSLWSSLLQVFGMLVYYSDVLVIAMILPVGMVTFYAIAGNLCEYARQLSSTVSVLMTPRVSALTAGGSNKVGEEIMSAARLASLVTIPIAVTFWFRGESFINLWMGAEYGPASGEVLRILAFVVLLSGARSVAVASIMGVNRHRTFVPIYASEAVCNLVLSVALVGPLGLPGVALGTVIPSVIVSLGFIPRLLSRATGTPAGPFYCNGWLLPMLACVPFALANFLLEHMLPAENLAVFFMQVILTLPLVAVSAIFLCLTANEKKLLRPAIRKVVAIAR